MNWMRSEAKRLSLLALVALAIQFGLCFGHTHLHFAWPSAEQQTLTASSASPSGGTLPDDEELCPICRTAAMTTSAAHAPPPTLQIPLTFSLVAFAPEELRKSPVSRHAAFRSRAPPIA